VSISNKCGALMASRKNISCVLRKDRVCNNGYILRDQESDKIIIQYVDTRGEIYQISNMDTCSARTLAKRINQFIDAGG
jgi:hypothetical protein